MEESEEFAPLTADFLLDVNVVDFRDWLEKTTAGVEWREFAVELGTLKLRRSIFVSLSGDSFHLRSFAIYGSFHPESDDATASALSFEELIIILFTCDSRKAPLAVTAQCFYPVADAYFVELLTKLARAAPKRAWGLTEALQALQEKVSAPQRTQPTSTSATRKGGPLPIPEAERRAIVIEWLKAQEHQSQPGFCATKGIDVSTLRRWVNEGKQKGWC